MEFARWKKLSYLIQSFLILRRFEGVNKEQIPLRSVPTGVTLLTSGMNLAQDLLWVIFSYIFHWDNSIYKNQKSRKWGAGVGIWRGSLILQLWLWIIFRFQCQHLLWFVWFCFLAVKKSRKSSYSQSYPETKTVIICEFLLRDLNRCAPQFNIISEIINYIDLRSVALFSCLLPACFLWSIYPFRNKSKFLTNVIEWAIINLRLCLNNSCWKSCSPVLGFFKTHPQRLFQNLCPILVPFQCCCEIS